MGMSAMVLLLMSNPSPLEELALQLERVPCLPLQRRITWDFACKFERK